MRFYQQALWATLLVVLMTTVSPIQAHGLGSSGRVSVYPEVKIVQLQDTFDLYLTIDSMRFVKSYLFDIEVDTAVIKLIDATREPFFTGPMGAFFFWKDTVQVFPQIGSRYVYEMQSSIFGYETYVNGPGNLAKMKFVAVSHGTSPVVFRHQEILNWHDSTIAVADSFNGLVIVCPTSFYFGDADFSGAIDISDAVFLISYIFSGGPAPSPIRLVGDANCSGDIDISDAVYLVSYIFAGGPAPCDPCL